MISYIVWDLDPRIFGDFEFLRWYGICWAVGMIAAYELVKNIYIKEGDSLVNLDRLVTYLIVGIIIGARLGHVLFYDLSYYLEHPIEILPIRLEPHFQFTGLAGLASHGGIAGALIALFYFYQRSKIEILPTLDRLVIGGALLGGFIRFGNLMNSEILGTHSEVPWAFIFARIDAVPRHPAQLYEALFYSLIAYTLYRIWKGQRFNKYKGFLFGLGITLIFIQRFLVEFVKENQVAFEEEMILNMGQWLSLPIVFAGLIVMWYSAKTIYQKEESRFSNSSIPD